MRLPLRPWTALLLSLALTSPLVDAAETLRLRADAWMPYNGDPTADQPGYTIEIARAILAPHGIALDYQMMPWGEARKAVAAGEIEAIVGANREEAAGLVLPQECVGMPRVGLYTPKGSTWRYENVAALRNVRLGVMENYSYWAAFDAYIAKAAPPHVTVFHGEHPLRDGIAQLEAGTIDVLAETSSVFAWTAKQTGHASTAFRLVYLHEGDPVFFCFTPRGDVGARYARLFDEGLRNLRRTGELSRILARYGLSDWQ